MPEISRFLGISIKMYFNLAEHNPPHFHAKYGEYEAAFCIETLRIIEGKVPARIRGLVVEWVEMHQDELRHNWELLKGSEYKKIKPLV